MSSTAVGDYLNTSQVPQQWSPLLRMTFSSRHPKKPGFDRSGCDTAADKRVIVCTNCWGRGSSAGMLGGCCWSGLCPTQSRACTLLSHNAARLAWHHWLCPFSYAVFPHWFLACPYCSVRVCVLLFSSDSIQIILNILSAVRNFPESYLNVNKSLMVYVKEGKR